MKKITYIMTNFPLGNTTGGKVSHIVGVVQGLLNSKVDLKIVCNEKMFFPEDRLSVIKPKILFSKWKLFFLDEWRYNLTNFSRLKKIVTDSDYIYTRFSGHSWMSVRLARKKNIPIILEYNGSEYWEIKNWKPTSSKNNVYSKLKRKLIDLIKISVVKHVEQYNLSKADYIVAISKPLKEDLMSRGFAKDKILVNPNGVDEQIFRPMKKDTNLVDQYALEGKTVIGFIGTFGPWHGAIDIVSSLARLLKENPSLKDTVHLLMMGEGTQKRAVEKMVQEESLDNQVTFVGSVPKSEVPKYLSVTDILVNATVPNKDGTPFFGSPTKLFEYMAMGKAIISTNFGQMAEVLEDDKTALLIEPNNLNDFVLALKKLIEEKELRERLGANARKVLEQSYTWDIHVKNILKFVQN